MLSKRIHRNIKYCKNESDNNIDRNRKYCKNESPLVPSFFFHPCSYPLLFSVCSAPLPPLSFSTLAQLSSAQLRSYSACSAQLCSSFCSALLLGNNGFGALCSRILAFEVIPSTEAAAVYLCCLDSLQQSEKFSEAVTACAGPLPNGIEVISLSLSLLSIPNPR